MIAEWSHLALVLALPLVGLQLLLAFLPAAPLGLNEALRARVTANPRRFLRALYNKGGLWDIQGPNAGGAYR